MNGTKCMEKYQLNQSYSWKRIRNFMKTSFEDKRDILKENKNIENTQMIYKENLESDMDMKIKLGKRI